MKLVLSRKGFDSQYGGIPSPIFPDKRLFSLPIPAKGENTTIGDLHFRDISVPLLVEQLSGGQIDATTTIHRDPDLDPNLVNRNGTWSPAFGQAGAAQGHLENQGVGVGDVFLFYGWFREVENRKGIWRYRRNAPGIHAMFGWLKVCEVIHVGDSFDSIAIEHPDIADHPHLSRRDLGIRNTVYKGKDAEVFDRLTDKRVLTAPKQSRSLWQLPAGFSPRGRSALTYHSNLNRWGEVTDNVVRLQTVAKGQEFVLDLDKYPEIVDWVAEVIAGV